MYDLVVSQQLDWPSLTVQWLPGKEIVNSGEGAIHRLVLGTNTSGKDTNYLMMAEV